MIHISLGNIKQLLHKEWLFETQQNYVFWSLIIFIVATVFLIFTIIGNPDDAVWIALFWLTQIFVSVNAISKSFLSERQENFNFYYFIFSPVEFILSKIIYNSLMMLVYIFIMFLFFIFFLGVPAFGILKFLCLSIFCGLGFNLIFTFLSALVAKVKQNAAFVSILGFPLLIPQIMLINKINDSIFVNQYDNSFYFILGLSLSLDFLMLVTSILLYPFLWQD